jgi:von Willebrand factor type A domain
MLTSVAGVFTACGARSGLDALLGDPDSSYQAASSPPDLAPMPSDARARGAALPSEAEIGCVDITRRYTPTPPTVMLLIDQSASMRERFGTSTRWDVLRSAIVDPDDGLLTWLDESANIGLMLYTSLNGFEDGQECPIVERVDVRLANASRIREFYAAAEPLAGGDTPTADAIDVAVSELRAVSAGPSKYVLLLTDGVPDTCSQPDPQNGFEAAVEAVVRARAQGILVRTVGVSPDIARAGLQRMANAGAGKSLDLVDGMDADAERPLYASTEPSELADQLKGAIGDVRSCTIELGTDVENAHALEGRVSLDGLSLEYGAPSGWSFEDQHTLSVHGEACRRILGNGERLEVQFPCDSQPNLGEIR